MYHCLLQSTYNPQSLKQRTNLQKIKEIETYVGGALFGILAA